MSKKDNIFNAPWSSRGPVERVVLIVAASSLTVLTIVGIRNGIRAAKERRDRKKFEGDAKGFIESGQKLSYPKGQYVIFANTIKEAINTTWYDPTTWGTNERTVAGVMYKMKNDLDVNELISAFGKKDGKTLTEWINGDFSEEDKNFYVNDILRKKNIKYRF